MAKKEDVHCMGLGEAGQVLEPAQERCRNVRAMRKQKIHEEQENFQNRRKYHEAVRLWRGKAEQ